MLGWNNPLILTFYQNFLGNPSNTGPPSQIFFRICSCLLWPLRLAREENHSHIRKRGRCFGGRSAGFQRLWISLIKEKVRPWTWTTDVPGKNWSPSSSSDQQTASSQANVFFFFAALASLRSQRIKASHSWTPSKTQRKNTSRKNNNNDYIQTSGQTHFVKNCALGWCFFVSSSLYRIKRKSWVFIDLLNFDVLIYLSFIPSPKT